MPLDIKLDLYTANDCADLMVRDVTGDYSEANPGGWGGFNAPASSGTVNIIVTMILEVRISPTETRTLELVVNDHSIYIANDSSIQSTSAYAGEFVTPNENSLRQFKLKIGSQALFGKLLGELSGNYSSYGLTSDEQIFAVNQLTGNIPEGQTQYEELFPFFTLIKDAIYKATPTYINSEGDQFIGQPVQFNNVCLTQKMVDEFAAQTDFRCEDCDDTDVDQVSLAYSLLEALKNI